MHVGDISIDIVLAQSIAQPGPYRDYYREYKTGAHDNYDIKATSYSIPETIARLILCSRESQLILLSVSPVFTNILLLLSFVLTYCLCSRLVIKLILF